MPDKVHNIAGELPDGIVPYDSSAEEALQQNTGHAPSVPTLSIIGCGKVGKTLARLWRERGTFQLLDILNRSPDSAHQACEFIGGGIAVNTYAQLRQADIYLIAAGDDQIAACCAALASDGKLSERSIVFHCSGALSSDALAAAAAHGAAVASIHPIRSFADPQAVTQHFFDTYCGSEGDSAALSTLTPAFDVIGGRCVAIKRENKILYHAAAVFASNYLVTLIDVAQQAYIEAGLPSDVALRLIEPLLSESAANAFRLGPATALTGPIARGDMDTVRRQYDAVRHWSPEVAALYEQFEALTLNLARQKP
ncbi:DUF2520 domain-containing protein [Glaciimonas sp. PAMC28666]|nr:DUF2520 domain-containing protein [Glaciimonas sp. PAMC28666]